MNIDFTHNGQNYQNWTAQEARDAGVPEEIVARALQQNATQEEKDQLRAKITLAAGDQASLLGTTADATALTLYGIATIASKLSTAQSLSDVRDASSEFADLAGSFLQKVESGEVKLPFQAKGVEAVISDIEARSTAVSNALLGNPQAGGQN